MQLDIDHPLLFFGDKCRHAHRTFSERCSAARVRCRAVRRCVQPLIVRGRGAESGAQGNLSWPTNTSRPSIQEMKDTKMMEV